MASNSTVATPDSKITVDMPGKADIFFSKPNRWQYLTIPAGYTKLCREMNYEKLMRAYKTANTVFGLELYGSEVKHGACCAKSLNANTQLFCEIRHIFIKYEHVLAYFHTRSSRCKGWNDLDHVHVMFLVPVGEDSFRFGEIDKRIIDAIRGTCLAHRELINSVISPGGLADHCRYNGAPGSFKIIERNSKQVNKMVQEVYRSNAGAPLKRVPESSDRVQEPPSKKQLFEDNVTSTSTPSDAETVTWSSDTESEDEYVVSEYASIRRKVINQPMIEETIYVPGYVPVKLMHPFNYHSLKHNTIDCDTYDPSEHPETNPRFELCFRLDSDPCTDYTERDVARRFYQRIYDNEVKHHSSWMSELKWKCEDATRSFESDLNHQSGESIEIACSVMKSTDWPSTAEEKRQYRQYVPWTQEHKY